MRKYLIPLILFLCHGDEIIFQAPTEYRPVYYSNILGVKVISIDKVFLLKVDYNVNSIIPASNFRAVVIKLQIIKNLQAGA